MAAPKPAEQPDQTPAAGGSKAGCQPAPLEEGKYRCGTLAYTKAGLFVLFSWLLWGDFCFTLFEGVGGPGIIPLYLQDNFHISNFQVNIMFNTIPMLIGAIMTPVLSFKSDRHRGRWGRRIPFMLFTAPFLCFFAAALGCSDLIMEYLKNHLGPESFISPCTLGILIVGFLLVGFTFFNEFVGTVYWYLFADVVPPKLMGRFLGLFRMVGTGVGVLVNVTIAAHQLTHMMWLHIGVAVLYFIGFGLMCWRVKEGEYPPVTDVTAETTFWQKVKIYFRECFWHPVYIMVYVYSLTFALGRGASPAGVFGLHLNQHRSMVQADTASAGAAAMSADGKLAVSGGTDGQVKLWDCAGGKQLKLRQALSTQTGPVRCAAITPDGRLAATGTFDGLIIVWNTLSGQPKQRLQTGSEVRGVALSKDGSRLVSGEAGGQVKVWDIASGQCVRTLAGHSQAVNSVALSEDETRAVSGGSDQKIIIWDLRAGTRLKTLEGSPGPVYSVTFAPALEKASAPPVQQTFLMKPANRALAYVREVFTNESLFTQAPEERATIAGPDLWVVSGGRDGPTDENNSLVRIWSVAEGTLLQKWKGHKQAIFAVRYKPDLRMILSGSSDSSIRLWDPVDISAKADDQSQRTFSGYTTGVTCLDCAAQGPVLVNAGASGALHLWDMDQGVSLRKAGYMAAFFAFISLLLQYPMGALVDRFHPIRITLLSCLLITPLQFACFFLISDYRSIVFIECFKMPLFALQNAAGIPMLIMVFPKEHYGQMCSANALVRSLAALVGGLAGSLFLDWLTQKSLLTDNYRYGYLWLGAGFVLGTLALSAVYYQWKKLGGDKGYVPPEPPEHKAD